MTEHTHDAWIIGTHELPDDLPAAPRNIVTGLRSTIAEEDEAGFVLLHDLEHNRWSLLNTFTFDDEYQFI